MHGRLGTDCTQASPFGCIRPEGFSCCLGVCDTLPVPKHQSIASLSPKMIPDHNKAVLCTTIMALINIYIGRPNHGVV